MNFKNMSLEDLQTRHSEMCATAGDLGIEIPKDLTLEFDTQTAGEDICERVDALIQEGIKRQETEKMRKAAKEKKAAARDKKKVAPAEGKAQADGAVVPPPPEKKETKTPQQKMAEQKAARLARDSAKAAIEGEKTVAKKAVKKGAAKKAVAKKKASNGASAGGTRTKFPEDAKVTWTAKENPARKDTARWERYEKLRKASGKTVKAVLALGVPGATLINAKAAGTITIK